MTDKTVTEDEYGALVDAGFFGTPLPAPGFFEGPVVDDGTFSAGRFLGDWSVADEVTLTWKPDFTAPQEDEWDRAVKKAQRMTEPVDDDELDPYWDTMRAYFNNGSPSAGETVQALKATIKVLREMMKE